MKKSVIFLILLVICMPISFASNDRIYICGGDGLVASKEGNDVIYHSQDFLGSNRLTTDKDGNVINKNLQYPFGDDYSDKGSKEGLDNNYKFTGQEQDEDLYYYGARYYDPLTSRFISVDPVFDSSISPYAYVGNNPLKYVDPSGNAAYNLNVDTSSNEAYWDFLSRHNSLRTMASFVGPTSREEYLSPNNMFAMSTGMAAPIISGKTAIESVGIKAISSSRFLFRIIRGTGFVSKLDSATIRHREGVIRLGMKAADILGWGKIKRGAFGKILSQHDHTKASDEFKALAKRASTLRDDGLDTAFLTDEFKAVTNSEWHHNPIAAPQGVLREFSVLEMTSDFIRAATERPPKSAKGWAQPLSLIEAAGVFKQSEQWRMAVAAVGEEKASKYLSAVIEAF